MEPDDATFIVTGAAGFIGSHLARRLAGSNRVRAVDCFTDYYDPSVKRANLQGLIGDGSPLELIERNIVDLDWQRQLRDADAVFHLAAQAGVRASWGQEFEEYIHQNIRATQVLLEAMKQHAPRTPLILASSSSVYGIPDSLPMREDMPLAPYSPYGVTKLAAENLGMLYAQNFDLPVTALRFFTVYGPGQRPDMAFTRFLTWIYRGDPITVYGDGTQTRDFSYVSDVVDAMLACYDQETYGEVFNVGGGERASLNEILDRMESVSGRTIDRRQEPVPEGDVPHTDADTRRLRERTGWDPSVTLEEGLNRQWEWIRESPRVRDLIPHP